MIKNIRAQLDALEKIITNRERPVERPLCSSIPPIEDFYDLGSAGTRWMTCAQICEEIGIEPSQSNCNLLGRHITQAIPRRRSNGRRLLLMPDLIF